MSRWRFQRPKCNHRLAGAAAVALAALVLAACGSSSSSSSSAASSGASSSSGSAAASSGSGTAKKGNYVIALSNSFLGNTWRQTMVRIFQDTAKQAQAQGQIKSYTVENTGENTATEQVAQLKSLILKHVNAILIDAASPDALNPTIQQACSAGITVVVFDSLATAPCAYKLEDSIAAYGAQEGHFVAAGMGGKGNLLMVRGVVGSAPEAVIYQNQLQAIHKYPDIHIVRTLIGQASNSITQQAVGGAIPSLPTIQGVVTGGSSLGAVQAFQSAGKPVPVVAFDNSGEGLRFWENQLKKDPKYNAVSVRTEPGQAAAAFWIALNILNGQKVKNQIYTFPNIVVTKATLSQWLKVTPNGNVAAWMWTPQQTQQVVNANLQGNASSLPTPPIPTTAP